MHAAICDKCDKVCIVIHMYNQSPLTLDRISMAFDTSVKSAQIGTTAKIASKLLQLPMPDIALPQSTILLQCTQRVMGMDQLTMESIAMDLFARAHVITFVASATSVPCAMTLISVPIARLSHPWSTTALIL
jgi:hypothetical protein